MPNSNGPQDVEVTSRLSEALRDYADVTLSITADAPPDRLKPALRRIWDTLWEVGSTTPLPTGDLPTPSYVSQPAGPGHGPWTITVDFGHAPRTERGRVPTLIGDILREHDATPAAHRRRVRDLRRRRTDRDAAAVRHSAAHRRHRTSRLHTHSRETAICRRHARRPLRAHQWHPAILFVLGDQIVGSVSFDIAGGKIATVRGIAAPTNLVRLTEAWRQHEPDTPLITQW